MPQGGNGVIRTALAVNFFYTSGIRDAPYIRICTMYIHCIHTITHPYGVRVCSINLGRCVLLFCIVVGTDSARPADDDERTPHRELAAGRRGIPVHVHPLRTKRRVGAVSRGTLDGVLGAGQLRPASHVDRLAPELGRDAVVQAAVRHARTAAFRACVRDDHAVRFFVRGPLGRLLGGRPSRQVGHGAAGFRVARRVPREGPRASAGRHVSGRGDGLSPRRRPGLAAGPRRPQRHAVDVDAGPAVSGTRRTARVALGRRRRRDRAPRCRR